MATGGSNTNVGALTIGDVSSLIGNVAGRRLAIVVNKFTFGLINSLEDVRRASYFGEGASLGSGFVGTLFGYPLVVSDVVPNTDADGKVTRNSTSGAVTNVNTKGSITVIDLDGYEFGFGERFNVRMDELVTSGGIQIAGRARVYFAGRNDGTAYSNVASKNGGVAYGFNASA